jgi:ABC-type multidrug transport system fused ATPase/permease subunit
MLDRVIKSLPYGLKTEIGEKGVKLSGGEKQRIAIARALLKRPLIYIFDEATSALDAETEILILKNIKEYTQKATCVFIAHRLSSISSLDNILVLSNGRIIDFGDHRSLLQSNSIYYNLWKSFTYESQQKEAHYE